MARQEWRRQLSTASHIRARRFGKATAIVAAGLIWACAPGFAEAKLNARDIARRLFQLAPGARVDLGGQDLRQLDLSGLDFRRARMAGSDLFGTDLGRSDLSGADLHGARLDRAVIIGADFSGADLSGATLLLPTAVSSLSYDTSEAPRFRNANLTRARIVAHLSGADFSGADLTAAVFNHADMRGTLMTALRTELFGCDLTRAILRSTDLTGIVLRFAKMRQADLTGAVLVNVDLSKADLTGADLTGADIAGVDFDGAILIGTRGLETAKGLALARNLDKAVR
ncbi:pentapeptide repeat-containing protein [Bosea sp. Root381]|uniref:pentapeptide repeat-containing protein n=1 Tax=Bosea sp. Root381 TaxID=1736524 RepID=UPI0032980F74